MVVGLLLWICCWWSLQARRGPKAGWSRVENIMGLKPTSPLILNADQRYFAVSCDGVQSPLCNFFDRDANYSPATGEDCAICLERMTFSKSIGKPVARLTTCHHRFHRKCINSWLKDHNKCPICRKPAYIRKGHVRSITRGRSISSLIASSIGSSATSVSSLTSWMRRRLPMTTTMTETMAATATTGRGGLTRRRN